MIQAACGLFINKRLNSQEKNKLYLAKIFKFISESQKENCEINIINPINNNFLSSEENDNSNIDFFSNRIRKFTNSIKTVLNYLPGIESQLICEAQSFSAILNNSNDEFALFEDNFNNLFVQNQR